MKKEYEYWVQDQKNRITLRYYSGQLEQAIEGAAELFNSGKNPITIWKIFLKENKSIEIATFFHKEN